MIPVKFNDVSHHYGKREVLKDLTFEIGENLITVIIGKSGSGKSTLLQIINGLVIPTSGQVLIFGNKIDYDRIVEARLKIGYAVQGTGLFPHMNVYENISLLARVNNKPAEETDKRITELMRFVNLKPEFKDKYPYQLSGGEQQRVGICRAMLLNPPVFLLDEAFGALDPATRTELHTELLNLQKHEPRTIVMVTHDMHEAEKLADNIMILDNGIIQQYDKAENVINNPANEFVENFIRSQKII